MDLAGVASRLRCGRRFAALALAVVFALVCGHGCSGQNPLNLPTEKMDAPTMSYEGTARLHPEAAAHLPSRVAVLPFVNETESPAAADTVRRSFYNHFSTKTYEDVELAVVDKKLAEAGLADPKALAEQDPQKLAELLHVDGLVYGTVTHFDRIYAVVGALVNVGAKVRLVDARTGDIVWEGQDVAREQEGELPTSIIGAIGAAASAAMNMRQVVLLRGADELFRGMTTTIPEPTVIGRVKPPAITSLLHDSAGRVLKAGDTIHVSLAGEPEMIATASLAGLSRELRMAESATEPGRYEASYQVVPGDQAEQVVVSARLEDKRGNSSLFTDALGAFTVDTQAPPAPEGLVADPAADSARLAWSAVAAKDLAGYRVYQSATPLTGFAAIADTQFTEQTVAKLATGVAAYFRVAALDRAGNESPPSAIVEAVPRSRGATAVTAGPLVGRVTWWAAGSPYRVSADLTVPKGAVLTIEPGTVVELEGAAIVVEGGLVAAGEPSRGITFRAARADGAWKGLTLASAEVTLRNVAVEGADVGIAVRGVSPTIESCHVERSGTGLVVEEPFAKPTIRGSAFVSNREDGVVVRNSAAPVLEANQIGRNGRHGLRIDAGSPRLDGNSIEGNGGDGVLVLEGAPVLAGNALVANRGVDLRRSGSRLEVGANWWGSAEPELALARVAGPVVLAGILTRANGAAEDVKRLAPAPRSLAGPVSGEVVLSAADSPYTVAAETVIGGGARMIVGPGVTLAFASRGAALVVDGGSIVVLGTTTEPVRFVSAQRSAAPGDYRTAIEIRSGGDGAVSRIEGAQIRNAEDGLVIGSGEPEITHTLVRDNLQSGVRVTGKARPKITHSTITANQGTAGIEIAGEAKPHIESNNVTDNAWPVQSRSTQYVFAQRNWWGGEPDAAQFLGNVDFSGWLTAPDPSAPPPAPAP